MHLDESALSPEQREFLTLLKKCITIAGEKHWTNTLKKTPRMVQLLDLLVPDLTKSIRDRTLIALRGDPTCSRGRTRKYGNIYDNWKFCGRAAKCPCARAQISQSCIVSAKKVNQVAKANKIKETVQERYGVDNVGKLPQAIQSRSEHYDDENRVAASSAKAKRTIKERDSYKNRRVKKELNDLRRREEKLANANKWHNEPLKEGHIRCMVCNRSLHSINKAHLQAHGHTAKSYREKFPDAPLASVSTRYGRGSSVRGKKLTTEEKRFLSSIKMGVSQGAGKCKISKTKPEYIEIIHSTEKLAEFLKSHTIVSAASIFGISTTFLYALCNKHGLKRYSSSLESVIGNFLESEGIEFKMHNRTLIRDPFPPIGKTDRLEIDIWIPSHNLAIELGGLYWHSSLNKNDNYHEKKRILCSEQGIRLLTIFEDEVNFSIDIVKSRILNLLGKSPKGKGARKLQIRTIDKSIANAFYDSHHMQGGSKNNKYSYGAYDGENLVAAMSFKPAWRAKDAMELSRFATDGGTYAGIASRLFNTFIKEHTPDKVVTYADRRWSEGEMYTSIGFSEGISVQRSYTYWAKGSYIREDKTKFRKDKIGHLVPKGDTKTEREITEELGYYRIYDSGHLRFEWFNEGK